MESGTTRSVEGQDDGGVERKLHEPGLEEHNSGKVQEPGREEKVGNVEGVFEGLIECGRLAPNQLVHACAGKDHP